MHADHNIRIFISKFTWKKLCTFWIVLCKCIFLTNLQSQHKVLSMHDTCMCIDLRPLWKLGVSYICIYVRAKILYLRYNCMNFRFPCTWWSCWRPEPFDGCSRSGFSCPLLSSNADLCTCFS